MHPKKGKPLSQKLKGLKKKQQSGPDPNLKDYKLIIKTCHLPLQYTVENGRCPKGVYVLKEIQGMALWGREEGEDKMDEVALSQA